MDWDSYFMSMVYLIAAKSRDPSSKIGALIVNPDNQIIATGYNGFPRGIGYEDLKRQGRPLKYSFYEHAERNSCYQAARIGISTKECRLYTTSIPCADCGRAIIQVGITSVMTDRIADEAFKETWGESQGVTLEMFKEAGVTWEQWEGKLMQPIRYIKGQTIK